MSNSITRWASLALLFVFGCAEPPSAAPEAELEMTFAFLQGRQVYQPQLLSPDGSSLLLVWREEEAEGSNIYVARTDAAGTFLEPVRVNSKAGSVGGTDLDEIRPALAVDSDGSLAIAWGARGGNIYAAVSRDNALTFGDPIRLNQDEKRAYRGFPSIAFDVNGVLHGTWIDARDAPPRAEEPADLYLAVVEGEAVREINLTARQEASICGCCRTSLQPSGAGLVATFRNTGGGYRDVSQISIQPDGSFNEPTALAAPMWELEGCPMAGPVNPRSDQALWMEASLGHWRLLADQKDEDFSVLLEEDDDWMPRRPPRVLNSHDVKATDLLVPGDPHSRRLSYVNESWQATADQLPNWATSGVLLDGRLLLIGAKNGEFRFEERPM